MSYTIRCAKVADAQSIQSIYAFYTLETPITFEVTPPSVSEIENRIIQIGNHYPWLVYEDHGEVLGYAYACQHRTREAYRWSVDVAVYVRRGQFRAGIGRQLYTKIFQILPRLGYANAFAGITLPNDASVGLHEAMGFKRIGIYERVGYKMGSWYDVGWWQLFFKHLSPPLEPLPFDPMRDF